MSNLEKKLAAGVRAARDEQDDSKQAVKPEASKPAASTKSAPKKATGSASKSRSTAGRKPSPRKPTSIARKQTAKPAPSDTKATADEPWTNLHPDHIWPD